MWGYSLSCLTMRKQNQTFVRMLVAPPQYLPSLFSFPWFVHISTILHIALDIGEGGPNPQPKGQFVLTKPTMVIPMPLPMTGLGSAVWCNSSQWVRISLRNFPLSWKQTKHERSFSAYLFGMLEIAIAISHRGQWPKPDISSSDFSSILLPVW